MCFTDRKKPVSDVWAAFNYAGSNKKPPSPPKQNKQASLILTVREYLVCLLILPAVCSPESIKMEKYSSGSCGFSLRRLIYFERAKRWENCPIFSEFSVASAVMKIF